MIEITLPGEPKALQRHRTIVKHGVQRQFDPQKKKKMSDRNILYAHLLKEGYLENTEEWKKMTAVVHLEFYFYRPPSFRSFDEDELNALTHDRKPDVDNCIKYTLDLGNQLLWDDDCQVTEVHAKKFWSKLPRTKIKITYNNII